MTPISRDCRQVNPVGGHVSPIPAGKMSGPEDHGFKAIPATQPVLEPPGPEETLSKRKLRQTGTQTNPTPPQRPATLGHELFTEPHSGGSAAQLSAAFQATLEVANRRGGSHRLRLQVCSNGMLGIVVRGGGRSPRWLPASGEDPRQPAPPRPAQRQNLEWLQTTSLFRGRRSHPGAPSPQAKRCQRR